MKRFAVLALLGLATAPSALAARGAPGTPDRAFGKLGMATISDPFLELVPDVVATHGRSILVGARAYVARSSAGPGYSFFRLRRDGRVDRSFGTRGRADTNLPGAPLGTVLPDGGLAAASLDFDRLHGYEVQIVRLLPDGARAAGFGDGGLTTLRIDRVTWVYGLVSQPGGGLVVALARYTGGGEPATDLALVRLDPSGRVDPSFGSGGIAQVRIDGSLGMADLAARPGGGLILAASRYTSATGTGMFEVVLAAFHPDGQPDRTFGPDGTGIAAGPVEVAQPSALAVGPDGRIGLAGEAFRNSFDLSVWLYDPAGATAGFGTFDLGRGESGRAVEFDGSGRLLVAGSSDHGRFGEPGRLAVVRLHPDGRLDRSFGRRGRAVRRLRRPGEPHAIAVQRDGRVLVAGAERIGQRPRGPNIEPGLVRLLRLWGGGRVRG